MLLAVNIPSSSTRSDRRPFSFASSSSAAIWPLCLCTPATNASMRSTVRPSSVLPASIGPPETKIVGMLTRIAPMNIPGTILSQFGMQIMASKRWASIIVSTLSAISSREGSEYFIPLWPIAIPCIGIDVVEQEQHAATAARILLAGEVPHT